MIEGLTQVGSSNMNATNGHECGYVCSSESHTVMYKMIVFSKSVFQHKGLLFPAFIHFSFQKLNRNIWFENFLIDGHVSKMTFSKKSRRKKSAFKLSARPPPTSKLKRLSKNQSLWSSLQRIIISEMNSKMLFWTLKLSQNVLTRY